MVTIILNDLDEFPLLKDTSGYLAVKLVMKPKTDEIEDEDEEDSFTDDKVRYAIVEMPKNINRFVVLPPDNGKQYVMMLDDVIRYCKIHKKKNNKL